MEKWKEKSLQELRHLARQFRAAADTATFPGYAGRMNRAADELEQQARTLELATAQPLSGFTPSTQVKRVTGRQKLA